MNPEKSFGLIPKLLKFALLDSSDVVEALSVLPLEELLDDAPTDEFPVLETVLLTTTLDFTGIPFTLNVTVYVPGVFGVLNVYVAKFVTLEPNPAYDTLPPLLIPDVETEEKFKPPESDIEISKFCTPSVDTIGIDTLDPTVVFASLAEYPAIDILVFINSINILIIVIIPTL